MDNFIVGLEITKLSHKIVRALEAEIITSVDKNMSATTARIICFVTENSMDKNISQKDIEKFMGLNRSSVSLILNSMEKNDFIRRETSVTDARYRHIVPTEKAKEYHTKISKVFDKVEDRMKVGLDDLEHLKETLLLISKNLGE